MGKNGLGKEIAIVIALGLAVALGITLVFLFRSDDQSSLQPLPASPSPTPMLTLPEKEAAPIEFVNLENESVFDTKAITINGRTSFKGAPIVVFVNGKDFYTDADDEGNFTIDLNLESGSNQLEVFVVDENNVTYSDARLVVYTNKSLDEILITDDEVLKEATHSQEEI